MHPSLHELTNTHKTLLTRDNGTREYVNIPSLLQQLRDEVASSSGRAGGASSRSAAPVAFDVIDLYRLISKQAQELKFAEAPNAKTTGSLESMITAWATSTPESHKVEPKSSPTRAKQTCHTHSQPVQGGEGDFTVICTVPGVQQKEAQGSRTPHFGCR